MGGKVIRFLEKEKIEIQGFLIDRKYWNGSIEKKYSYPAYILEDYISAHSCNLIVAFAGYNKSLFEEELSNTYRVYVCDFIGKFVLENFDGTISRDFLQNNKEEFECLEAHLAEEKSKKALEEYIYQRMSGVYRKECYEPDQYFPGDIIQLQEGEIFVDCGAYHGKSAVGFMRTLDVQHIKEYRKIISGVWNESAILYMSSGKGDNSQIAAEGDESIEVRTIDEILSGEEATYIKMDIEGSELKALQGAQETIRNYKPKLAVCIYHKVEDLIEIPKYIYHLRQDYKFYIRNHSPYGVETVLYAV